jgi:phage terminase large subunit
VEIVIPYDPRPHQRAAWEQLKRFNVLVWHRRAGKTVFAVNALLRQVLESPRKDARGIYVAPTYKQAKRIAWAYLREFAGVIPGTRFLEQELRCILPGGKEIWLLGADNPDALRGIYVDHGVLDEVGQMSPRIWGEVLRPALADRGGGALFIGTPFGPANLFAQLYEKGGMPSVDWWRSMLRIGESGALPPAEIEALRREMSPEEWAQEMECSFNAAVRGAFYGALMDQAETAGRIGRVPHDPATAVHTSWDLGVANRTVVWCWQVVGAEIRAIDCRAWSNTGLPQIIQELRALPYAYGTHYAPHDAAARELGSGKSRVEMARALGLTWTLTPQLSVQDGIDATRAMLPRVWFDAERCRDGIQALRLYRTEWDPDRRVFSRQPLHDWTSDYADSVRMFAVGSQGRRPSGQPLDYSAIDRMFA